MENQNQFADDQYNYNPLRTLPNSTIVLVLGITSFAVCLCCGFFIFVGPLMGMISAIIALILAKRDKILYAQEPAAFTPRSYSNLKIGRIFAIIGLILSIIYLISLVVMVIRFGIAIFSNPADIFKNFPR